MAVVFQEKVRPHFNCGCASNIKKKDERNDYPDVEALIIPHHRIEAGSNCSGTIFLPQPYYSQIVNKKCPDKGCKHSGHYEPLERIVQVGKRQGLDKGASDVEKIM